MKKSIKLFFVLILLSTLSFGQNIMNKTKRINDFSGDTIITYEDNPELNSELLRPRNNKGELVGVYGFKLSSEEHLLEIVFKKFTNEEINKLISSNCVINFICLPNGKIKSASFEFVNKEPDISMSKFSELSRRIKNELTLNTEFKDEVANDGYVKCTYRLFAELMKKRK